MCKLTAYQEYSVHISDRGVERSGIDECVNGLPIKNTVYTVQKAGEWRGVGVMSV